MASHTTSGSRVPGAIADPDAAILEQIRAGDTGQCAVLIRRYNQRLYRVARAHLRDEAGVEDVMQEAYLKAFRGLSGFRGRALFSTWLTRILIMRAGVPGGSRPEGGGRPGGGR